MNKEGFHKLSLLLTKKLDLQNELLVLEKTKTKALVDGNIEKIEEILKAEQTFLFKSDDKRKKVQALLKEMGICELSLQQVVHKYDPHNIYSLQSILIDLEAVSKLLKVTNETNQKIIQSRLTIIDQCFSLIGLKEDKLTYKQDGRF